jgi:Lipid A 3-O-deacylase (PagL).
VLDFFSIPALAQKLFDIFLVALSHGYLYSDSKAAVPSINAQYRYAINKDFSVGASLVYEKFNADILLDGKNVGTSDNSFLSPLATLRYEYAGGENFGAYFDVELGLCYLTNTVNYPEEHSTTSRAVFAGQFTPFGFRFGNKFNFNLGIGFGMKGLVTASAGYSF